jgi:lipid-A-disaccharide synthase
MKYYIISGEASGDLHGANLVKSLRKLDPQTKLRAWGGDLLQAEGAHLVKHYRDLAFMGFLEVILNIRVILKNLRFCKEDILDWKPDLLILIDYPGFNLRIAEFAHQHQIPVVYYISPQIWAWKQNRVHQIKRVVDRMLVILPFEKDFYAKFGVDVEFVGHPLLDELASKKTDPDWKLKHGLDQRKIIALLPGSRKQEISSMLPLMLEAAEAFPDCQPVVAAAPGQHIDFYKDLQGRREVKVLSGETYALLENADAALVTSGTATLETALFGVPEVVCYRGNRLSVLIARRLIKVRFISLVNLIMNREVVKELIQDELNVENLRNELRKILRPEGRLKMLREYDELKNKLGGTGASEHAAQEIVRFMKK